MQGKLFAAAVALSMGACATGASYEVSDEVSARLAEFERTGDMTTCLNVRRINKIDALDERTFLVTVGLNDYYLNELSRDCNGADSTFNRLQYETSISQLCRNQIMKVVDNSTGFTVGSCGLSSFERLEKKIEDDDEES